CPIPLKAAALATETGALECLKYLIEHDCPLPDFSKLFMPQNIVPYLHHLGKLKFTSQSVQSAQSAQRSDTSEILEPSEIVGHFLKDHIRHHVSIAKI